MRKPKPSTIYAILLCLLIVTLMVVGIIVDMEAYRQRFPDAAAWTYFFQSK